MLPFLPSPISSAPAGHRARNEEMTGHIIQSCTRRYRLKEKTKASATAEAEFSHRIAHLRAGAGGSLWDYLFPAAPGKSGWEEGDAWGAES